MQTKTKGDRGTSGGPDATRRSFLLSSAAGAGALAASMVETRNLQAAAVNIPSITIPKEIPESMNQPPKPGSFEGQGMTGAEVFAKLCKEEELAAMFCCPGNYTVINAIAAAGVPSYGGRSEGSMCAAADGFSRVTGEVTACSGTEGPGFTNMIMNIAAAAAARTPLLVLASNMQIARRRSRSLHPDRAAAADDHGDEKVRQAADRAGSRVGVRRVCLPQSEVGRAQPGPSGFSGRSGASPLQRSGEAEGLLRQGQISHRVVSPACAQRHPTGRGADQPLGAPVARGRPGRVSRQGLGRVAGGRREKRSGRGNHRARARPLSRRASAVGQPDARCADERRSGDLRGPILHAQPGRISLQPRREGDPRSSRCRGSWPQLAVGPGNRLRRKTVPGSPGRRAAPPEARSLGQRAGRGPAEVRQDDSRPVRTGRRSTARTPIICTRP